MKVYDMNTPDVPVGSSVAALDHDIGLESCGGDGASGGGGRWVVLPTASGRTGC